MNEAQSMIKNITPFFLIAALSGCQPEQTESNQNPDKTVDCNSLSEEECGLEEACTQARGTPIEDACEASMDEKATVYFGCFPHPKSGECEGDGEICLSTDIGEIYLTYYCTYGLPICTTPPRCNSTT